MVIPMSIYNALQLGANFKLQYSQNLNGTAILNCLFLPERRMKTFKIGLKMLSINFVCMTFPKDTGIEKVLIF